MSIERKFELAPELVAAYSATFVSRFDIYAIQLGDGRYITVKKQLTLTMVESHLKGFITLGAYALDADSRAKWICLDADTDENWGRVVDFADQLKQQNVPVYLESSRRGGHLWLFFPPMQGQDARRFGKQLMQDYGLPSLELYPKQDALKDGSGSLVRLPLGRHRLTGRRYGFITLKEKPLAPTIREQIALLSNPNYVPQTFIEKILQAAPESKTVDPTPQFKPVTGSISGETLSERIKNSISVFDFVSQYVQLDPQNRGYCPFHDDQHMSFGVNPDRNYWNCFVCGGGSIIDFYAKWLEKNGEDPSFAAVITELVKILL